MQAMNAYEEAKQPAYYDQRLSARGQLGGALAEARQLEVPHQMEMLDRNIKGIAQGLEHLENRLSESILRSQPPQPPGTAAAPTPVQSSSIGSRLQDTNTTLAALNDRVQNLIQRLEA